MDGKDCDGIAGAAYHQNAIFASFHFRDSEVSWPGHSTQTVGWMVARYGYWRGEGSRLLQKKNRLKFKSTVSPKSLVLDCNITPEVLVDKHGDQLQVCTDTFCNCDRSSVCG